MNAATPAPVLTRAAVGVDLGKLTDYSALASLVWTVPAPPGGRREYDVPTLHRWPLGTPYLDVADGLARFLAGPVAGRCPLLVLDATGVGEPVCELVRGRLAAAGAAVTTRLVTITGGSAETPGPGGRWRVAKKQLVSVLQVLLGTRRLRVAAGQPEARTLMRELETFQVKISDAGNETFESWRERDHDDLVLAVALAAWAAERCAVEPFTPAVDPDGSLVARALRGVFLTDADGRPW
jgi:hypothetical protein